MAQENRTANLTTAALGYHHQSNAAEAHRLLTEAEALAPQAPTVQQAAAAIENAA